MIGRMIDAPSAVVAATAANWFGQEGTSRHCVPWHSAALACLVGIFVVLRAYLLPSMIVQSQAEGRR